MLDPEELEDKFLRLIRSALGEPGAAALFERLQRLEDEKSLSWLGVESLQTNAAHACLCGELTV